MADSVICKRRPALAVTFACLTVVHAASGTWSSSRSSHLRAGLHVPVTPEHWLASMLAVQPPAGVAAAPGPAASPQAEIASTFAKMDVNNDGKVDVNEFVVAEQTGILPLHAAPEPAPAPANIPPPVTVAGAAPAPSLAKAEDEDNEILPPHLQKPPPLPQNIPEPPPPPRAPPPEPAPPPLPPREGQLVGPPPRESSMEAAGNATAIMAAEPGLDLEGTDPVQAPNTPPPIPVPLPAPALPKLPGPLESPETLPDSLMNPSPVAFGIDMAHTLPSKMAPLEVVAMPPNPSSSTKLLVSEPAHEDPLRVLLSLSSHRHAFSSDHSGSQLSYETIHQHRADPKKNRAEPAKGEEGAKEEAKPAEKIDLMKPMKTEAAVQGFEGETVQHKDGETASADWHNEYGHEGPAKAPPKKSGSTPCGMIPTTLLLASAALWFRQ